MDKLITTISDVLDNSGFAEIGRTFLDGGWKTIAMLSIACVLIYLAIVKQYEPLLLLPIAFGMLLANLPFAGLASDGNGLFSYLYYGVKYGIYPPLIFLGIGMMTDFGPLIANPKSLLLGAAAQFGIFAAFIGARLLGFSPAEAGAIGIIGGADGPTAIYTAGKLAEHLLPSIAVAAYSYMALVPVIQPPIMKLLTTKKERAIDVNIRIMRAFVSMRKALASVAPVIARVSEIERLQLEEKNTTISRSAAQRRAL